MILRESAMANVSPAKDNWPPRSAREALLSSPSGRKKVEQRRSRHSPSPSPMKRPPSSSKALQQVADDSQDEDEDEETLQLKLQAIEARLKLKKLRAKAKPNSSSDAEDDTGGPLQRARATTPRAHDRSESRSISRPQSAVEVPLSPVKDRKEPKSPARMILGIDKGLRAQDVSLKRASSLHTKPVTAAQRSIGGSISRSSSQRYASQGTYGKSSKDTPRPKSFSERIAESRASDRERLEKEHRIQKSRSQGFGIKDLNSEDATSSPFNDPRPRSRGISPLKRPPTAERSLPTSRSETNLSNMRPPSSTSALSSAAPERLARPDSASSTSTAEPRRRMLSRPNAAPSVRELASEELDSPGRGTPNESDSLFDSYSGIHLTQRHLPHKTVASALHHTSTYTLPQLLKVVKSPDYDSPDDERDFVVLAVVAQKSTPKNIRTTHKTTSTGDPDDDPTASKFMILRLTDFKWELDLFLFDSAFSQYWKLTVGTVVAILNPGIMPPRNRDSGAFSLKIASSEDAIMEIGLARDLGFCKSLKKDGQECGSWVDKRKTEHCDFHVNMLIEKTRRGRMEVNTMADFGKRKLVEGGGGKGWKNSRETDKFKKSDGRQFDKELRESYYVAPAHMGSAAKLLDDDDAGAYDRGCSRQEMHRKKLAEREKERELAKKLSAKGAGMGSEYMRIKHSDTPTREASLPTSSSASGKSKAVALDDPFLHPDVADAGALGLLGNKASDVKLSPVKRKRLQGNVRAEPMGWGGAFKSGLPSPVRKSATTPVPEGEPSSPTKKKARFILKEKGIRLPGRESLPNTRLDEEDDDDDGLDII